jgi:hypothetical protein
MNERDKIREQLLEDFLRSEPTAAKEKARMNAIRSGIGILGGLGGLGFSAYQRKQGLNKLKEQAPAFDFTESDPMLLDEISQAQVRSQLGSPALMRSVDEGSARTRQAAEANALLASQGQSNLAGSIMQEGALAAAGLEREGALTNENVKMQQQAALRQLLGQRQAERGMQSQERSNVYDNQLQQYLMGQMAGNQVASQGTQGILDSIALLLQDSPDMYENIRKIRGMRKRDFTPIEKIPMRPYNPI